MRQASGTIVATEEAVRLVRLRKRAGYASAAEAARAMGVSKVTYQHHENARRALTVGAAQQYAKFFRVDPSEILFGSALRGVQRIPIIGQIGGGAGVRLYERVQEYVRIVPLVENREHIGLEVGDQSFWPAYAKGDLLILRSFGSDFRNSDVHGKRAIVTLEDGRRLLRYVSIQIDRRLSLTWDGEPPIVDAVVHDIAIVVAVVYAEARETAVIPANIAA